MSKKFFVLLALFLLVSAAFIAMKMTYSKNSGSQYFPMLNAKPTSSPETTLSLSPNPLTVVSGRNAAVDVIMEVTGEAPSLVQFEIEYDPNFLADVNVVPGDFFLNPTILLNTINPRTGRISYALEPSTDQNTGNRTGTVAHIMFTPISSSEKATMLSFLPKTMIRKQGEKNILKVGYGTRVIIHPLPVQPQATNSAIAQ